ncbi:scm-like with four MBT domains protein 2 isoform X1 [Stigmatopora argus]
MQSPLHHSSKARAEEEVDSDHGEERERADFNWQEHLEEMGASAAPHAAFNHVELSLRSSFQPGMKLEVANKGAPDMYWVASIVATCGQLLLLRFSGYGHDRRADFWCDVTAARLHPVGWCARHGKTLAPPQDKLRQAIEEKHGDWTEFLVGELTGSRTPPANLLEGPLRGKNAVDLIVPGAVLELRHAAEPFLYWPARVLRNVGGRLRLRLAGLSDEHRARDVWLFYLDVRLRPLGWAGENRMASEPPAELRNLKSDADWQRALEDARRDGESSAVPPEAFQDRADLPAHAFKVGMKLEMVSQWERLQICPVSVTKVFDEHYYRVTADDLTGGGEPRSALCHADSAGILPVQWCLKNGAVLERPRGYPDRDFDWADYLKRRGAQAAPDTCFPEPSAPMRAFAEDTWLETAHPERPERMCVARIAAVRGRLLWLRLEGVASNVSETIVDAASMDIFPLGWCDANAYPLSPPIKAACRYPLTDGAGQSFPPAKVLKMNDLIDTRTPSSEGGKQRQVAVVQPEKQSAPPPATEPPPANHCQPAPNDPANGRYCCSKVFVNHRCFSGPYLNKGRIAELPQAVGPGKCTLVLKELLSMLINSAYKPGRVLKELQELEDPAWDCQEETLKAKYKGKSYRSSIRIVRLAELIPDFCRKVCLKLQCCPNLVGPALVPEKCPESCFVQTKTKYTYYYGKKRKLSKPQGGEDAAAAGDALKARRKKRKSIFVQKKRRSSPTEPSANDDPVAGSAQESEEDEADGTSRSGSEGTGPESRRDPTDGGGGGGPPRRVQEAPEARRRSARQLPPKYLTGKEDALQEEKPLVLDRNPLEWSVQEVVEFINSTDCASLANIFQEQVIDGQAMLLLTLPTVQECMDLKLGPAIKLCHHIERVKVAFYRQYAN